MIAGENGRIRMERPSNEEANALTRRNVESALLSLMEAKPFEEISISDITRIAGVSRTAYYRNYGSKDEILSTFLQQTVGGITEALAAYDPVTDQEEAFVRLFELVRPLAPQYRVLLEAGFGDRMLAQCQAAMIAKAPPDDPDRRYSEVFWAGAIYATLTEWVRQDLDQPEDAMAALCSRLIRGG